MSDLPFDAPTIQRARRIAETTPPVECDPRVEALVNNLIGRVADKWTMIALEVMAEHGELRFTQLARQMPGISQKMLTQTLRQMERDGMVTRTVHAVVPPRVDYRLTAMGGSLGAAFCGVWIWAEENLVKVEAARDVFDAKAT
ncbi:MAG: winged helix-turn-helix transcriptional regulator [Janthinobacterium lividum]